MTYYSLLALYDGKWSVQFGDYERAVVRDEQRDWLDSEPETQTIILTTKDAGRVVGDSQAAIDAAVARLNGLQ